MRQHLGVEYAILGVISRHAAGIHGYAIKRQCDRVLGNSWALSFGEVYRTLNKLAAARLIGEVPSNVEGGRKTWRMTDEGSRRLETFILAPPTDVPRQLRQQLVVKLLFASPQQFPALLRLIDHQRNVCVQQFRLLELQRRRLLRTPVDPVIANLILDGAEKTMRAEVDWLDETARKLAQACGRPSPPRVAAVTSTTSAESRGDASASGSSDRP